LKGLVYDVALGHLQLPPTLKILHLDMYWDISYTFHIEEASRDSYYFEPFTFWMARRVVYALAKQYPRLRQIHIGPQGGLLLWVKDGDGVWQAELSLEV